MRQAFGAGNGNLQDEAMIDTRMQKTAGNTEVRFEERFEKVS
jgi:hypothetical protein